jgi:hypothetical protein
VRLPDVLLADAFHRTAKSTRTFLTVYERQDGRGVVSAPAL